MTLNPLALGAYELAPMTPVSNEQLAAIIDRHGLLLDGPAKPMVSTGVVHALWSLGSQWVLRVPKNEELCIGDHLCESVAVPLAREAGVRTPAIVAFDDSLEILPVPYTVIEQVHGRNLMGIGPHDAVHDAVYRQLGEQLAILHRAPMTYTPNPLLRTPDSRPAEDFFEDVIDAGLLHRDGVEWLQALCHRLDARIDAAEPAPRVMVHDDINPANVMLDTAGLVHMIDWGDAGYGDPATDFQGLPLCAARAALEGYRRTRHGDQSLESRVIRNVVARSLHGLRRTPKNGPGWRRPIAATLTDLLTFAADNPALWTTWTS